MGLVLVLLIAFLLLGGVGHARGWGYYGWSPLGLLVVVVIVLLLAGVVHAEALAPLAAAGLLLGLVNPTPPPRPTDDDHTGPPGLPFSVSWWIGVVIMLGLGAVGYVIGNADSFELTRQQLALVGLAGVLLGGLGRVFPNLQHTVAFRQRELERARRGVLPRDLHKLAAGGEPPAH
jgi:uncharacterized protein DUF3309